MGEGTPLALVGYPSSDGITIKILYEVDVSSLGMTGRDGPRLPYHPCKSRKRRLGQAMKSPPQGNAASADIDDTKF